MGALVNGDAMPDVPVRIPLAMMNRHGLVAGATGTGKTRTLQGLAEQLAANGRAGVRRRHQGRPVRASRRRARRTRSCSQRTAGIGQDWTPAASVTEYFALGGIGKGVPDPGDRLGLRPAAAEQGARPQRDAGVEPRPRLPLRRRERARAASTSPTCAPCCSYLTSDEGKAELKELGGLSAATAGVILRELITFADQGADVFFGEPEIDIGRVPARRRPTAAASSACSRCRASPTSRRCSRRS